MSRYHCSSADPSGHEVAVSDLEATAEVLVVTDALVQRGQVPVDPREVKILMRLPDGRNVAARQAVSRERTLRSD